MKAIIIYLIITLIIYFLIIYCFYTYTSLYKAFYYILKDLL